MAMDPVTGAVLGWVVGQVGTAGTSGLARLVRGDRQQDALRQVVGDAVVVATSEIADGAVLREALLVELPGAAQAVVADVLDLNTALNRNIRPTLEMLAEQGYVFDAGPFAEALARQVVAGIEADAVRGGPLAPLAEFLRHERAVAELRGIRDGIDHLARAWPVGLSAGRGLEGGGLPGEIEHFIGRQQKLEELLRWIEVHDQAGVVAAVCVVDGMPGVGKTAFVIHAGHMLADRYPDGAIFVDLLGFTGPDPLSVTQALDELLAQAGVPRAQIPAEVAPKQAMWWRLMRTRRALIVLDNARDAGQVEPLLPQSSGCLVLVTARSKLYDLDATPLPLDVLTAAEARSLFVAAAGADRCHDPAAVERVVAACHRLPLAIRLMASRVRHGNPIGEVADEVEQLPQEKKIRGVFDLSYDNLDGDLRRALRLLGVYPGLDITGEAMAALADTTPVGGRRLLRGLATHNLIDRLTPHNQQTGAHTDDIRYQPHDLLRDYARTRAETEDLPETRAAALDRLTANSRTMVAAADRLHTRPGKPMPNGSATELSDVTHAHAWLITERANLLACLDAAPTAPLDLSMTAGRLLDLLCYWPEATRCFQRASTMSVETGDWAGQAEAQLGLADVTWTLGRYEQSQEHAEQAHRIFREIADRSGEAGALLRQAHVNSRLGQHELAHERYLQARDMCAGIGDRSGQAYAVRGLGRTALAFGRPDQAYEHDQHALTIFREIGDRRGEASALWGLADIDRTLDRHKEAQRRFEDARAICREIGDRSGEAYALWALADTDMMIDQHTTARNRYHQSLGICRELGDQFGEACILFALGKAAEATADTGTAAERWREALQIFQTLRIPFADTVRDALTRLD